MSALTLAVPALGLAQDVSTTVQAPAPALRYESAFAGYKAYEELAPADWRAGNDAVGQASQKEDGHAAAAAGVSTPAATSGKPAIPSTPSDRNAHGAHGAHGGMK